MNDVEAKLAGDLARILEHIVVCALGMHGNRESELAPAFDKAEADCLALIGSTDLQPEIKQQWELDVKCRVQEARERVTRDAYE